MADVNIEASWKGVLEKEFAKPYFDALVAFVKSEYKHKTIYPPGKQIFSAFDHSPFAATKVVILGQDPYHGAGQAHGLCFSVNEGVRTPPSLQNVFKEIKRDLGKPIPPHGNLERWAGQGVLLLNSVLTVEQGKANAHKGKGWEIFTDAVIQKISQEKKHVVFMLWGSAAHKKGSIVDTSKHLVLKSVHPSPLVRNSTFIGNGHFSQANAYLVEHGFEAIDW
ncbi:MAG: uracil-DNA glycosylase [Bernardetiaceae bacterium]|nr:uracil-DNA glycosylase [Bernardetiaceae bacterium]